MPSFYETFWKNDRYAVVGNSAEKPFPRLTYRFLKERGAAVFPVDPSAAEIEGDTAYPDLESLPDQVEAVVIEAPPRRDRRLGAKGGRRRHQGRLDSPSKGNPRGARYR